METIAEMYCILLYVTGITLALFTGSFIEYVFIDGFQRGSRIMAIKINSKNNRIQLR